MNDGYIISRTIPDMLKTVVEEYISAALDSAISSEDEDDFVSAYIPGYPGIRAHGDDRHACYRAMWEQVETWVKLWLEAGYELPVFDGVDLNSAPAQVLATYDDYRARMQLGLERTYEDDGPFLNSLEEIPAV